MPSDYAWLCQQLVNCIFVQLNTRPELIIQSILPIIQIFYSQFPSLLFKKLSPILFKFFSQYSNTSKNWNDSY